jgi:hypothetical protein
VTPIKVKNIKPEVTDRFQDGRRRHFGNSSECYKMGSHRPIVMKFGTQTETEMLSSKITKAEVCDHFQDGRCNAVAILEKQVRAMKQAIIARFQHACISLCTKFHQISIQKQQRNKYAE